VRGGRATAGEDREPPPRSKDIRHAIRPKPTSRPRFGLHAAEATKLGANYAGMCVHTAARIGAIAGAGEIVASASSIDGLDELEVSNRRMVDLKRIAGPVEVVTIGWT
jgi:class 3 adenylate cyclase